MLDAAQTAAFRRLLENWVSLAIEEGDPAELANAIERDRVLLDAAHLVDRQWATVREMIDERFTTFGDTRDRTQPGVLWLAKGARRRAGGAGDEPVRCQRRGGRNRAAERAATRGRRFRPTR